MTTDGMYGPYSVHPLLEAFPLMEGVEFDLLVEDIQHNGLGHPIILSHDKSTIIDGRNRYRACDAALVDPVFRALPASFTETQIIDRIISENLRRVRLNPDQFAFAELAADTLQDAVARQ